MENSRVRSRRLVLPKGCTPGAVPFGEPGPSVEQPPFGMGPLEIINNMEHVELQGNKPWIPAPGKGINFPFIYNNAVPAWPLLPHTLMHVHSSRANLLLKRWEICTKQQEPIASFVFFRNRWPPAISDLLKYMERCGSIPLLQNWRCRCYIQVSSVRKRKE